MARAFMVPILLLGAIVLSKCANPLCSSEFVYLRQGRLFEVETQCFETPSRREYYWLCEICAVNFTLRFDWGRGVVVTELGRRGNSKVVEVSQSSANTIVGLTRVLIRPFGPSPTQRKTADEFSLSEMEES